MELTLPHHYVPRPYQVPAWRAFESGYKRLLLIHHRRAGKDKTCINMLARSTMERVGTYFYFLPTFAQAKRVIWDGMDGDGFRFINHFPRELWDGDANTTNMRIRLKNGSVFQLVGSDKIDNVVGTNPIGCVFSEYSLQDPSGWEFIRPILLENGGWAIFNGTPRGKVNHLYELYKMAKSNPEWYCEKLSVDDTGAISDEKIQSERDSGMDEELIQQEYYCCPPGTLVATPTGVTPIEKMEVGDVVLSHSGRARSVKQTMSRPYEGDLVQIVSYGSFAPLSLTPNHPVRVLDPASQTYSWVEAGDIKKGDMLVMPRLKEGEPVVSRALALMMAWYAAEGSQSKTGVQFTLGAHEQGYAEEITKHAADLGYRCVWREQGSTLQGSICSTSLCDLLKSHCGGVAPEKRLPLSLLSGHWHGVLDALIAGDGCDNVYDGVRLQSFSTTSPHLAQQVQLLAHSFGYRAGVSFREGGEAEIEGRVVQTRDGFLVQIRTDPKRNNATQIIPAKHGVGVQVRKVFRTPYSGFVYNLGVVHDESYIANGRAVHNCSFEGGMQGAYYVTQMLAVEERGGITEVPFDPLMKVNTAWDLGIGDNTSIIFYQQSPSGQIRIIDHHTDSGMGLDYYAGVLFEFTREKGYLYGQHLAPWDIQIREMGTGKSRLEVARSLGVNFKTVRKLPIDEGINAVRMMLPMVWFNTATTEHLRNSLMSYSKKWNATTKEFGDQPRHDWASHDADAMRTLAVGRKNAVIPERQDRYARRYTGRSSTSWMAA